MSADEVTQLKVGGSRVGIIGLKSVLSEVAAACANQSDEEIRAELLKRLNQRNYIAASSGEAYGRAFLREFKKFTGQPVKDGEWDGVEIKVLGPGCPKCQQTGKVVLEAVAEAGVDASYEKVTDALEIAGYGVFGTPAVVVDGDVKSVGKIPQKEEVKTWLGQ